MYPFLKDGDEVEVAPAQIDEVKVGDVVFFRSGARLLAHRVVQIVEDDQETHLRTRGDSFRQEDPPVGETDLVGLVTVAYRRKRMRERTIQLGQGPARWLGVLVARSRIAHCCVRSLVRISMRAENVVRGVLMSGAERQVEAEAGLEEEQLQ
jgi:hypothetical protein